MSSNSKLDPLAQVLFDNSFLGVLITSGEKIELANSQATKLLGYSDDELTKKKVTDILKAADKSLGDVKDLMESATRCIVRAHAVLKDETTLPVDVQIQTLKDKSVVMLSDARTSELIEELKREFITKVSSDLRSPLTAISGSLAILKSERMARLSDSVRNVVTIAERNCKRLILMVNEILDLESLERGNIRLQPRRTDLKEIVEHAVEMVSAFCDESSIKVETKTCEMPIQGDEERLKQIFANLLRNAIRSSKKGGTVEVESSNEHGWAEVKVKFSPPAIAQNDPIDLADGISDALAVRSLEVCREVIALHRGFFGEDANNSNKCYWVRLPVNTK